MENTRRVLFLCTANSARSQMAEALLRRLGGDGFEVHSAGTAPTGVHDLTLEVLDEVGIDASGQSSKAMDQYLDESWDYVITVCDQAAESCPVFPGGGRRLHWSIPDPAAADGPPEHRIAAFRAARDLLGERVRQFLADPEG